VTIVSAPVVIMGVDPGAVSAAWAVLAGGLAYCDDVPVAGRMIDAPGFSRVVLKHQPGVAVVEKVAAMPKDGVSSSFRFGQGLGILQGVLAASGIEIVEVTPGMWKKYFRLGPDKELARAFAIKRFPNVDNLGRKKDAGRAEALLMALWFKEQRL
jgi:crossover junction endodeoxyribonuclease RuvC